MVKKISAVELGRRFCVAMHRGDLRPGPTGGVPCSEHVRFGQLYYGLLDERSRPMLDALVKSVTDEERVDG